MKGITNCLWFSNEAEDAAKFYTSLFKNSKLGKVARYTSEGHEIHGQPEGKVMTVEFELEGVKYLGLNGGPIFKLNEAFSIVVNCDTQEEIDHYWSAFIKNGGQEVQCGWLRDKFGVSWQIVPTVLGKMVSDPDPKKAGRVTKAFLKMKKFNIADLQRAYDGK